MEDKNAKYGKIKKRKEIYKEILIIIIIVILLIGALTLIIYFLTRLSMVLVILKFFKLL